MLETNTKERKTEDRVERLGKQAEVLKQSENSPQQSDQNARPLGERVGYAEKAHAAHIEAQRQVARAYRDNEVQAALSLRRAEQQARGVCDNDFAAALKAREEDTAQATRAYDKTVQEAKEALANAKLEAARTYQENIARALDARNAAIDEAWKTCDSTSEQSWAIYSRIL